MSSPRKKNKNRSESSNTISAPNIYPPIPGYPIPAQWLPPHPSTVNYPYQWYQPWGNIPAQSDINAAWLPPVTGVASASPKNPHRKPRVVSGVPDEFTVDSMQRVYNNGDESIEIERVKVLRRQGIYDTKQVPLEYSCESKALVPVSPNVLNKRRPPPRKHKKKAAEILEKQEAIPQPWYPYVSYLPQPFPFPYPFGYMWPMPHPSRAPSGYHSPAEESECSLSRQETFPASVDSPDLIIDKSRSPDLQRPSSSAATSHITESLGTDIAPSDSVSMRGFKRETSLERILRKSLASSTSERPASDDMEKTKEWMEDMQKAFESQSGLPSEVAGDRSSFATAPSDIPTPPEKHQTNKEETLSSAKISRKKSNSESNIDNQDEQRNLASLPLLESTRVSDSDLIYAFKRLENASDVFKTHAASDITRSQNQADVKRRKTNHERDERSSHASTLSFHSTRQSADENILDTDSTDIAVPIDSSTADESLENFDDKIEENYKWVLMNSRDTFESVNREEETPDDLIEKWRAEVSLWRARLVVSLCRGEGLDQQDWATFQLLAHHPLAMHLKLSLLHAHRLCSQNCNVGIAMLRNALLHLTTFGETLMKPEEERPTGWRTIAIDPNQPWVPVKGSVEILRVFGYYVKEDGTLKYRRKNIPEVSVIARLTLDLLVLAEEFRLFLNGTHQYPLNITHLFTPREAHSDKYRSGLHQPNKQFSSHQSFPDAKMHEEKIEYDSEKKTSQNNVEVKPEKQIDSSNHQHKVETQIESKDKMALTITDELPHLSETSIDKNNPTGHLTEHSSPPPPSDILSSSTSLPDLQLPGQEFSLKLDEAAKMSDSKETLTPMSSEVSKDKNIIQDNKSKDSNEHKSESLSPKTGGHSNPEDHIYEEIGETKAQVEALKTKRALNPPPLPPKAKTSSSNQELYPEWSVSSQCSSAQGTLTPRRKKRKAPKPPGASFSDEELSKSISENNQDPSKKTSHSNPFLEDIKPSGYVGKNPFYEDLVIESKDKLNEKETFKKNETEIENNSISLNISFNETSNEDISEMSEISVSNFPAGVRPQRKKDKNLRLKKNKINTVTFTQNEVSAMSNEEKNSETDSVVSVVTLKKNDSEPIQEDRYPKSCKPNVENFHPQKHQAKNEIREHQWDAQVVVSNDKTGKIQTESAEKNKKEIVIQEILITYDISLDNSKPNKESTLKERSSKKTQVTNEEKSNTTEMVEDKLHSTKIVDTVFADINDDGSRESKLTEDFKELNDSFKDTCTFTKESNIFKSNESNTNNSTDENTKKENLILLTENVETSSLPYSNKEMQAELKSQKTSISEPLKDTNQTKSFSEAEKLSLKDLDNKDKQESINKNQEENKENDEAKELPPPLLPPKAALRLLDDIPYIDTNDVKSYKANYNFSDRNQPPHYGLSEIQPQSTIFSELCGDEKASTFLKRSSLVPFIDDNDLPPDDAPPPPPDSPPSTPPLLSLLPPSNEVCSNIPSVQPPPSPPLPPPSTPPVIEKFSPPSPPNSPHPFPPELAGSSHVLQEHVETKEKSLLTPVLKFNNLETDTNNLLEAKNTAETKNDEKLPNREQMLDESKEETKNLTNLNLELENKEDHHNSACKPDILLGTEEKHQSSEFLLPHSDTKIEVISESQLPVETEEHYEIPDITRATACASFLSKTVASSNSSSRKSEANKNADNILPQKPPRNQLSFKNPPPRPPKPLDLDLPPKLPPKLWASSASSIGQRSPGSLPSTLAKIQDAFEGKSFSRDVSSSMKLRGSTSHAKSSPPKASSLSSLSSKRDNDQRTSSLKTSKTLPRTLCPPSQSVSMPCSPKVLKFHRKLSKEEKRSQKSWPYLFCDCVYPGDNNDDSKHAV